MEENQTILAVFPPGEDRVALAHMFAGSQWMLHPAGTFAAARHELRTSSIGVIISESRLPDGQWTDLLHTAQQQMRNPPPLIVADRLADERLWAEVLNLGGHDLLAKPFEASEVLYAVAMACRRRDNEQQMIVRPELPKARESSRSRTAGKCVACGGRD